MRTLDADLRILRIFDGLPILRLGAGHGLLVQTLADGAEGVDRLCVVEDRAQLLFEGVVQVDFAAPGPLCEVKCDV